MITISIPNGTPAGSYTIVPYVVPVTGGPDGDIGIDISQHNDVKDFQAVSISGKKVCIHRATKGSTGLDTQFQSRWPEMKTVGFDYYGLYHLFIPSVDGIAQYNNLMKVTGGDFGNYPITVDVEPIPSGATYSDPANQVIGPLRLLLEAIRAKAKYMPIVYTSANATQVMGLSNQTWLLDYPVHMAEYTQSPTAIVPKPWTNFFAWQHWNQGIVKGILGNVDLDRFYGQPFALAQ